jgi:hypothetical protein
MMLYIHKYLKLFVLLGCLLGTTLLYAAAGKTDEMLRLEALMLEYIDSNHRDSFYLVTDQLKKASQEYGNERLYYRAWGNQGIYEATQQYYEKALNLVKEVMADAQANGSIYGQYAALHAEAMVLLQKQDYGAAENAFLKAVDFHHRHFPNESAGEDLQELMKIANHRKDAKAGENYARQIINEPNVAPIHKGRALYRLSQMAFKKNDKEEFNRIYQEMAHLKQTDGISPLKPLMEVNNFIMNGQFDEALRLADKLDPVDCAERKAVAYHRMGDDAKAFKFMQQYKQISDSIVLVSHGNMVASCYVQMNNDRMKLEKLLLEQQNNQWRSYFYYTLAALILVILLMLIWKGGRLISSLKKSNKMLVYQKKDSERALTELNELSYYESKADVPLTWPLIPNEMCNHIADNIQEQCHRGVAVVFQTQLPDDFEIKTNPDALMKLLSHLLGYSARFTEKGTIRLACVEDGENIQFSVTDTSAGLGGKPTGRIVGMFSEQHDKIRYVGMNFNICQSITRLLHGRIWHDTEYVDGTRFFVEIPQNSQHSVNII